MLGLEQAPLSRSRVDAFPRRISLLVSEHVHFCARRSPSAAAWLALTVARARDVGCRAVVVCVANSFSVQFGKIERPSQMGGVYDVVETRMMSTPRYRVDTPR